MATIDNVTVESLEERFGKEEGFKRFAEIAKAGGFGTPTRDHTGGIDPAYRGGLDLKGLRLAAEQLEADKKHLEGVAADKSPENTGKRVRAEQELKGMGDRIKAANEAITKVDSILVKTQKETK